jgi:hypothetical protein
MQYPTSFDFKTNELFKPASDSHLNACVGDNGGPYNLSQYGDGFFDGGKAIVDIAKSGNPKVDVLVYPAAFSYRHGIELYLKHMFQLLAEWNRTPSAYPKNHTVQALWDDVHQKLAKLEKLKSKDKLSRAAELVGAFCEIDPTGQVFRYPENLRGNRHLSDLKIINLRILGDGMTELHRYLVDWQYSLEAHIESRRERDADVRS